MLYEKHAQGFLCVSVGNCKAFLIRYGKTNKITDITSGSRDYTLHEDDPGTHYCYIFYILFNFFYNIFRKI